MLNKGNNLPRELWVEQPNGDEIKWDILEIKENVPLSRKDFADPAVPPGWRLEHAPRATDAPPEKKDSPQSGPR